MSTKDFLRAIERETAAILGQKVSDVQTAGLRSGTRVEQNGTGHTYVFRVHGRLGDLGPDVLIHPARARRLWERATITLLPDGKVQLLTAVDLGEPPANVTVRKDDTIPLDLLADRIATAGTPRGPVDPATANLILGEGSPRIGRCADPARFIRDYPDLPLNQRQRLAIEHALGSELTFVWGPPGTGKTEVVGRIVEGSVRQGLRVLFLAPTKIAVDQALERICALLADDDGFGTGLVQRAGDIELASLSENFGSYVSPERIVARLAEPLTKRMTTVAKQLADVRDGLELHRQAADAAALLATLRSGDTDPLARNQAQRRVIDLNRQLANVEPQDRLTKLERMLATHLAKLEEERRKTSELVRDNCRVVGATVAKAVQSRSLLTDVDVVVIDEAGMVALPWAWCAAGLAGKRVVIAGDFRQLPAVTHGSGGLSATAEEQEHSRHWMDRDAFTAAGLVDATGTVRSDSRLICLDTQYRMRPGICAVVNEVAYPDAPLRTMRSDTSRVPASPLIAAPVVLIDTTTRRVPYPSRRDKAHRSNPVHVAVIHELVRGLQYDGVLPGRKWTDVPAGERARDRMAVIAPYRDQVSALKRSLKDRFGEEFNGLVDTVHRFQGSQRPVVVIDTVAGAGRKAGVFYEGTGLSSNTCRLLNVALSRAQDHLVVVADVEFLTKQVSPGSEVARLLHHLDRHAQRLSVDELIPVRSAADLAGLSEEDLARPSFFPADEAYPAVAWDIARARRSVDIYCPFLSAPVVRSWLKNHLSPRIAEGIRVTVHTRPPDEEDLQRVVDTLQEAGCELSIRDRMHEKVLIIDDELLWHGSLNLLATRGPTDLMMRLTDVGACEQVRRIMSAARMERPARPRPYARWSSAGRAEPAGQG